MPTTGTNSSGTSQTLALAAAATTGTSASSDASVHPKSAGIGRRQPRPPPVPSIAPPVAVSRFSATPNVAAAASTAGRSAAGSAVQALPVSAANVAAATAIASTDCAALKSAFAGSVRFTASATTQPSTYAAIPGAGPNIRTIASANAADSVSSSLNEPLPGSLIGNSSPATTKPASTA